MNQAVTAVVPVWNRRHLLAALLDRLAAQTHPLAAVLVADNGSTDGAAELAEARGARVLRMGSNTGFARAVNRGIAAACTPLIAVLNNDVEPAPDWLEKLVRALDDPAASFATGKILRSGDLRRIDGTFDALCRGACAWRVGHGRPDGPWFSKPRVVWSAPGTAALFRASLFERTGAFDERFESYLEDVELGLRCAALDLRGVYVPDALAWHHGSATLGRWHPDTVRRISRNQVFLLARHYPASLLLRYAWPILAAQLLWGVVAARHGAARAWCRGKWEGLAAFGRMRRGGVWRGASLAAVLENSEREIRLVQQATGWDSYWKWYYRLTRGGAN